MSGIVLWAAPQSPKDPYDAAITRSWVELDPDLLAGNSWLEKSVYRRGDRIALGIAHAFTTDEMLEPARTERILAIIRLSFSQPWFMGETSDAKPAVTMLLRRVVETEQYVLGQAKSQITLR
jgi:hypothetical protein